MANGQRLTVKFQTEIDRDKKMIFQAVFIIMSGKKGVSIDILHVI